MSRNEELDLNPLRDPERWERLVGSIVAAGESHLAERRERADVVGMVAGWARPALSVAATVLLVLTTAAGWLGLGGGDAVEPTLAASLVPETYAAWLLADYEPTVSELVAALDGSIP